MPTKKLFMGTTEIPPEKTAGQILSLLVQAGARQVLMEHDEKGKLVALKFTMEVRPGLIRPFALPARVEPVFKILNGSRKYGWQRTEKAAGDRVAAERIAWRQLLRWVEVQVAMIQSDMVEPGEVFLPYAQGEDGRTYWECLIGGGQLALPPAPPSFEKVVKFERE